MLDIGLIPMAWPAKSVGLFSSPFLFDLGLALAGVLGRKRKKIEPVKRNRS